MDGQGPVEKYILHRIRKSPICAALIDPEDFSPRQATEAAEAALEAHVGLILVGGSTLSDQRRLDDVVRSIKRITNNVTKSHHMSQTTPVVLFPGNVTGVSRFADAILFSSLLNSTNPYFIVGAQALGAIEVFKTGIESIPMGYLVFGNQSAAGFIGQVNSLPSSKPNLAMIYSLAAKYLGMRTLYLEGGSGASEPISPDVIRSVRRVYDGILITGGGITTVQAANRATSAGADILVVGNLLQAPGHEEILKQITTSLRLSKVHQESGRNEPASLHAVA